MKIEPAVSDTKGASQVNSRSSTYRPDIEGLRGIAVLLVVAFHCGIPGVTGGFVGVDVFFVLSGSTWIHRNFLVTEIQKTSPAQLVELLRPPGPPSFTSFRIDPGSNPSSLGALIMAPQELAFAGRAARATALYMSNIFFAKNAANYFSPDVESNPLLHTWSLAVEEQFYLVWPMLIMLGLLFWRSKSLLLCRPVAIDAAFIGSKRVVDCKHADFCLLPIAEQSLGIRDRWVGGFIARGLHKAAIRSVAGFRMARRWHDSGVWTLHLQHEHLSRLGCAAAGAGDHRRLSGGGRTVTTQLRHCAGSAPLLFLGTLSYSWYLWHWPFLVFLLQHCFPLCPWRERSRLV